MFDEQRKLEIINEYQSQDLQPFLNPICKQTYDALANIYGQNRKKRYWSQQKESKYSQKTNKWARDCCSRHFENAKKAIIEVKQLQKSKIQSLFAFKKDKINNGRRYFNTINKSTEVSSSISPVFKTKTKVLLPKIQESPFQQMAEKQSKHKVFRPIKSNEGSGINSLKNIKNPVINEIKKQIKADSLSACKHSPSEDADFKVKTHRRSLTYDHTQNDQYRKQESNQRYKLFDIKSTNHSQDDAFSISSNAIQKGSKLSTVFHKVKRKSQSKNEQTRFEKKRTQAYSVLSNGLFKIPQEKELQDYLLNYKPMNDVFDLKRLVTEQNFYIIPNESKIFFGQIQNQKKNGKGITISEKQIFQGTYNENMKVKGCQKNMDGVYTGYFLKGKRHGRGKFIWNNGQVFEGQWREGKKNGLGTWKSPKGDYYEGEWKDNRQAGSGTYVHYAGSSYKGEFLNFLKHGKGYQQFPNGDTYNGDYFEGKPQGKGRYIWANGDIYDGQFEESSRSGFGVLTQQNGQIYAGHFKNDVKNGLGKQIFRSGQQFEGEFKNGERLRGELKTKAGAIISIVQ